MRVCKNFCRDGDHKLLCRCVTADLSQNAIGPNGLAAICQAMTHNQSVQELILSTNNLADEGAEMLASFLASKSLLLKGRH